MTRFYNTLGNNVSKLFLSEFEKRKDSMDNNILYQVMYSFGRMGLYSSLLDQICLTFLKDEKLDFEKFTHILVYGMNSDCVPANQALSFKSRIIEHLKENKGKVNSDVAKLITLYSKLNLDLDDLTFAAIDYIAANKLEHNKAWISQIAKVYYSLPEAKQQTMMSHIKSKLSTTSINKYFTRPDTPSPHLYIKTNPGSSYMQRTLKKAIQNAGYLCFEEYDLGFHRVDLFIPRLKMFVEVDGLNHYKYKNGKVTQNLTTEYRDKLIKGNNEYKDYELLVIPTMIKQDS